MKKILSIVLFLLLALPASAGYDTSMVESYDYLYDFDVQDDVAFIDGSTFLKAKDLAFEHAYESDDYYSYVRNDLVLVNYPSEDQYPVWRTWIYLNGKKDIRVDSATFAFGGKTYTFTGLLEEDSITQTDKGETRQVLRIKHSFENMDFIADLETYYDELTAGADSAYQAVMDNADIRLTLHGTEELSVRLPSEFLLDFDLVRSAFIDEHSEEYLSKVVNGTPLTVTEIE